MLQNLLLEKLVKEYEFLQSEIKYKKAVIDYHLPELKPIKAEVEAIIKHSKIEEFKQKYLPSDIEKQIWRQISKITHPDKIETPDDKFHAAYSAYSSGNFIHLLKIAQDLKIEVKIDDDTFNVIESQIKTLTLENNFLNQHIIWQWYHASGEIKEILLEKIKNI